MSARMREMLDQQAEQLMNSNAEYAYDCTFVVGKTSDELGSQFNVDRDTNDDESISTPNKFRAIRSHLAHISGFFRKQLFGGFKESQSTKKEYNRDDIIYLENCDANIFECILRISYNLMPNISKDNIFELLNASDYYDIPLLFNLCKCWLNGNINSNNVLFLINKAYLLNCLQFKIRDIDSIDITNDKSKSKSSDKDINIPNNGTEEKNENDSSIDHDSTKSQSGQNNVTLTLQEMCLDVVWNNLETLTRQDQLKNWQHLHINTIEMLISDFNKFQANQELLWDILTHWATYQAGLIGKKDHKAEKILASDDSKSELATTTTTTTTTVNVCNNNNINSDTSKIKNDDKILSNYDIALSYEQQLTYEKDVCFQTLSTLLIQPLIKYVKFSFMSEKYFMNNVQTGNWLCKREANILLESCQLRNSIANRLISKENENNNNSICFLGDFKAKKTSTHYNAKITNREDVVLKNDRSFILSLDIDNYFWQYVRIGIKNISWNLDRAQGVSWCDIYVKNNYGQWKLHSKFQFYANNTSHQTAELEDKIIFINDEDSNAIKFVVTKWTHPIYSDAYIEKFNASIIWDVRRY